MRPRIVRDDFGPEVTFGYMLKHSIFPDDGIYLVKIGFSECGSDDPLAVGQHGGPFGAGFPGVVQACVDLLAGNDESALTDVQDVAGG